MVKILITLFVIASFSIYGEPSNMEKAEEKTEIKETSLEDTVIKALVQEILPELADVGAEQEILSDKFESFTENELKNIEEDINYLRDRDKRLEISGIFEIEKEIDVSEQEIGETSPLRYKDDVTNNGVLLIEGENQNFNAKLKFTTEFQSKVTMSGIELNLFNNYTDIFVFSDRNIDDEKLYSFQDEFELLNVETIQPDEGVVLSGVFSAISKKMKYKSVLYRNNFSDNGVEDYFGIQVKQDFDLEPYNMDGFIRFSYSDKVDFGKIVGSDLDLTIVGEDTLKSNINFEIARAYEVDIDEIEDGKRNKIIKDREAVFIELKNNLDLKKWGDLGIDIGIFNSGEKFDVSDFTEVDKELFEGISLIKLESDKKGYLTRFYFDYFKDNRIVPSYSFITYEQNIIGKPREENHIVKLDLNFNKYVGRFELNLEKDDNDEKDQKTYLTNNKMFIRENLENNINFSYCENSDLNGSEYLKMQEIKLYIDNIMELKNEKYLKFAGRYITNGLNLKADKQQEFELGVHFLSNQFEVGNYMTKLNVGSRYFYTKNDVDSNLAYNTYITNEFYINQMDILLGAQYENIDHPLKGSFSVKYNFNEDISASFVYGDTSIYEIDPDDEPGHEDMTLRNSTRAMEDFEEKLKLSLKAKF